MFLPFAAAALIYHATVIHAVDGDTLKVSIKGWPAPVNPISVRIVGIDTPEHLRPPAQSDCEVTLGLKAAVFARTLVKAGDTVTLVWAGRHEKYGRFLGTATLPDGRDWGQTMISGGFARAYGVNGDLHKAPWCADPSPAAILPRDPPSPKGPTP